MTGVSALTLDRRCAARTRPEDWVEGQFGVLELDGRPAGTSFVAAAPVEDPAVVLAELLAALADDAAAAA